MAKPRIERLPKSGTQRGGKGRSYTRGEKQVRIGRLIAEMIDILGIDRSDPNLEKTHERVADFFLEMFAGCEEGNEPKITTFPNDRHTTAMVIEKDIPFYSMCAHHFVPFYGHAHVAYLPGSRIIGLSKIPRILDFYARRPQTQERLTEQVATYLMERLQPLGVMVVIEAHHLCLEMRGVKKPGALTVTSAIRGGFESRPTREEFLDLLNRRG